MAFRIGSSNTPQGAGGVGGLLSISAIASGSISDTFYPAYDGNGNVSEYVNAAGAEVAHFEYDPFGNLTVDDQGNAASFPYRFSTKPQDAVTGLYYYGYRYYDPMTGRWPSRDPIGERGGINLYGFVGNDAVNGLDVLGLTSICDCVELVFQEKHFSHHGFLWLTRRESSVEVADGGSVRVDDVDGLEGSARWKDEAFDPTHPCCPLRESNPEPKMRIKGERVAAGASDPEDINFFQRQDFINVYPYGIPQAPKDWLGNRTAPTKIDRFQPRHDREET